MKEDQRKTRFKHCYDYVMTHDAGFWMQSLLTELINVDSQPHVDHSVLPPKANLEDLADKFVKVRKNSSCNIRVYLLFLSTC